MFVPDREQSSGANKNLLLQTHTLLCQKASFQNIGSQTDSSFEVKDKQDARDCEDDESILLLHLAQGDGTAFWQLWMPHQDYLYTRCLKWMGGNVAEAQEAHSQAMLKACKKLPQHAHKINNLRAWLTRLTHNHCVDLHRRRQRIAVGVENIEDVAALTSQALSSASKCPSSRLLQDELNSCVQEAIGLLPEDLRLPIILSFFHHYSPQEIAQNLSIPVDSVYQRIQRAKAHIKKHVHAYLAGEIQVEVARLNDSVGSEKAEKKILDQVKSQKNAEERVSYEVVALCLESQYLV